MSCATVVNIPGPPGRAGDNGDDGIDGVDAFALLTESLLQPAIGATVLATMTSTAWIVPSYNIGDVTEVDGTVIVVQYLGYFLCTDIVDATHATLYRLDYTGGAAEGTLAPPGSYVAPGGLEGPAGAGGGTGDMLSALNLADVADPAQARVNLQLGTMAVQDATAVNITGGSITGITDLAVADGGTGASTATDARTNLGAAASGLATASGITSSATDKVIGRASVGAGAVEEITCTSFARTLLDDTTAATFRTTLGVGALPSIVATAVSVAVSAANSLVLCDATGGNITIDLPSAATATSLRIAIKKVDASGNTVSVVGNLGETMDGTTPQVLAAQWDSIEILSDGNDWFIVGTN